MVVNAKTVKFTLELVAAVALAAAGVVDKFYLQETQE